MTASRRTLALARTLPRTTLRAPTQPTADRGIACHTNMSATGHPRAIVVQKRSSEGRADGRVGRSISTTARGQGQSGAVTAPQSVPLIRGASGFHHTRIMQHTTGIRPIASTSPAAATMVATSSLSTQGNDAARLERLAAEGHALPGEGRPRAARDLLTEALGLSRRPSLAEVAIAGLVLESHCPSVPQVCAKARRLTLSICVGRAQPAPRPDRGVIGERLW
jgi:hypothetical protein